MLDLWSICVFGTFFGSDPIKIFMLIALNEAPQTDSRVRFQDLESVCVFGSLLDPIPCSIKIFMFMESRFVLTECETHISLAPACGNRLTTETAHRLRDG